MANGQCVLGMVGLGVMGRNLLLNLADHGYTVAGYDKEAAQVRALSAEAQGRPIQAAERLKDFMDSLRRPRTVMMLVPAGVAVDAVLQMLQPYLEPGDLVIDGGNSHYSDTDVRAAALSEKGIAFLGIGISGGEQGAREGACFMAGGPATAYAKVQAMFEATAAKVGGEACAAYLGPGAVGHYVKMVHNGIEYGLLQAIAETYDVMKRGLGLSDDELSGIYRRWNEGELNAYLVETTACIFQVSDVQTGKRLVDVILDESRQKGTGKWTVPEALDLQVPTPTIDAAVMMRDLSMFKDEREMASQRLKGPAKPFQVEAGTVVEHLRAALYVSMIAAYAQGLAMLHVASQTYNYGLDLGKVARIWRGGCIIRAALLEKIRTAYQRQANLPNLLLDLPFGQEVMERQDSLRTVTCLAAQMGLPVPALMAALGYWDSYRSAWMPANLIQAQRDYFGAHSYERVDQPGTFHTDWGKECVEEAKHG